MRGRLCVGRAAAAAAVAVAVAVPLADGLEGSPGGVRRGSRGTTMVKKRKGRVVIDSDTEDSGSDENLDQVRAGREGAGRRSGRAGGLSPCHGSWEPGAGRARGHPSLAPVPPRALTAAAASFLFSPQLLGPSESGRGLEKEPRVLGALGGEAGQGSGWWASGSGDRRGPWSAGSRWGRRAAGQAIWARRDRKYCPPTQEAGGLGGGARGERGALGVGWRRRCGLWEMKFFRQVCGRSKGTTA